VATRGKEEKARRNPGELIHVRFGLLSCFDCFCSSFEDELLQMQDLEDVAADEATMKKTWDRPPVGNLNASKDTVSKCLGVLDMLAMAYFIW
jgi:hypothetical protein